MCAHERAREKEVEGRLATAAAAAAVGLRQQQRNSTGRRSKRRAVRIRCCLGERSALHSRGRESGAVVVRWSKWSKRHIGGKGEKNKCSARARVCVYVPKLANFDLCARSVEN